MMKILMFSADPTILDKGSSAGKKMEEYGRRVGLLNILVLLPSLGKRPRLVSLAPNVTAMGLDGKFARFFKGFFKARQMIKREKYDLLVAQDIEHAFMCWLLGGKWQMQIHADIFSPYFAKHSFFNKMRAMLAKFLIPRASCVRVVSERIKKSIFKTLNNHLVVQRLSVVVLPILVEPLRTSDVRLDVGRPSVFSEFDKTILMVSRLTSEKNIGLAIDAVAEVVKKHPKTGLIIVGDGPEREALELKAKNYKLTANIKFEGWKSDVALYYKGAEIFLLTSWYEGWGMSAVEAMRHGAAVVMTDVGLAGELVENGKNGLIVPVGDKNALIGAISRLLENNELRRDLIEEAAKKVQKLPLAEEYYQKMVESWQKCANS